MEKSTKSVGLVKGVVIVAIGAALYGLGGLIGIPIFANTTIKPAMAILALFAGIYGPFIGFLVGFLGHIITDSLAGWGIWVTWAIGSGLVGIVMGLYPIITKHDLDKGKMNNKNIGLFILLAFLGNFFGYLISAILDYFLYSEPLNKVITQQLLIAFVNTVVIAILGTLLMKLVASRNASKQNLVEEEEEPATIKTSETKIAKDEKEEQKLEAKAETKATTKKPVAKKKTSKKTTTKKTSTKKVPVDKKPVNKETLKEDMQKADDTADKDGAAEETPSED